MKRYLYNAFFDGISKEMTQDERRAFRRIQSDYIVQGDVLINVRTGKPVPPKEAASTVIRDAHLGNFFLFL